MSITDRDLKDPPIVEAVLDIDCAMPPKFDLAALEAASITSFGDRYPKFRRQLVQELQIQTKSDAPPQLTNRQGIQALQFRQEDDKQLVQIRMQGFSFNRLAPYKKLDDYLPEIERTWRQFVGLAAPVQIRLIRLRYINRILLPMVDHRVDLDTYLKLGPRLPDEDKLTLLGFLNQRSMIEGATGYLANTVLSGQTVENDKLPIIFDNCVMSTELGKPENWPWILAQIQSLRDLKNRIFESTLTEECLKLFHPSKSAT